MQQTSFARIGIISDTHGLLREEALTALRGSDLILHAGDIGGPDVLAGLRAIAPVRAIRGNNDRDAWAHALPEREIVTLGELQIYMLHDLKELDIDPARAGHHVVVSGHSHKPLIEERNGVLYVNPGSAGPRRFSLPVSVAHLAVRDAEARAELRALSIGKTQTRKRP